MDRNNPAEIDAAKDRKIPNEIVTLSEKNLVIFKKGVYFVQFTSFNSRISKLLV